MNQSSSSSPLGIGFAVLFVLFPDGRELPVLLIR